MKAQSAAAILLVEDNDTIRGAFAVLLEESGYTVLQAPSGEDALRLAARDLPDLILMDIGLPDLNGLEVARHLKHDERTRQIPIVAITGRALETDVNACLEAGCAAYLTKPVDTGVLLAQIARFLAGKGGQPQ